ncbi:MAG: isopentenyl phosphate kinase [Thermoproteota archaeon]
MESVVVKLGGSVITKKDEPLKERIEVINNLANQISTVCNDLRLCIVHGGGSFGHYVAKKYAIHQGLPRIKIGLSMLEMEMRRLNLIIANSLINHGVPVIQFSPIDIFISKGDAVVNFFNESIKISLDLGYIPLLYGDVIFDYDKGCRILSGDQICLEMAKLISAKKIVFCMDATGVYDKDPKKYNDAKLIRKIESKELELLINNLSKSDDVTGGIVNKLKVAHEASKLGIKTIFISGFSHNMLKKVLKNEEFIGTEIY